MARLKFTEKTIASLPLPKKPKQTDYFDTETKGLSVRVSYSGTKVYQLHSANIRTKLGAVGEITLKEARKRALVEKVKQQASTPTRVVRGSFKNLISKYKAYALEHEWNTEDTRKNRLWLINRELMQLGEMPVSKISKDILRDWIKTKAEKSPSIAGSLCKLLKATFSWAHREDLIEKNPALALKSPYKKEGIDRILKRHEIRELWFASAKLNPLPKAAFRLLLYTAQRKLLVERAFWSGVDKEAQTLTFTSKGKPGKQNGPNIVTLPLSDAAFKVVLELERYKVDDRLFPSHRKTFSVAAVVRRLIKDTGIENWSAHDIRRTVSNAMQNELEIPFAVRRACLDQRSGDLAMYVPESPMKLMRAAFEKVAQWIHSNLAKDIEWTPEAIAEFNKATDERAWDSEKD